MDRLPVYHSANTYRQRNTFAPTGTLESLGHLTWPNAFGLHAETEAHGRSSCRHVENTQKCSLCIITISVKIAHSNPLLVWLSVTSIFLLFKTHICVFFFLPKEHMEDIVLVNVCISAAPVHLNPSVFSLSFLEAPFSFSHTPLRTTICLPLSWSISLSPSHSLLSSLNNSLQKKI